MRKTSCKGMVYVLVMLFVFSTLLPVLQSQGSGVEGSNETIVIYPSEEPTVGNGPNGTNLLSNPSFEKEGEKVEGKVSPAGWEVFRRPFIYDSKYAYTGSKSVGGKTCREDTPYDERNCAFLSDYIPVKPEEYHYHLAVWVKFTENWPYNSYKNQICIWLTVYDADQNEISGASYTLHFKNTEWQYYHINLSRNDAFPVGSKFVRIGIGGDEQIDEEEYEEIEVRYDDVFFGPDEEIEQNEPPEKPILEGKTKILLKKYDLEVTLNDPDEDEKLYAQVDWGDLEMRENYDMYGPFDNGETVELTHRYEERKEYTIRVKAIDDSGKTSDWETLDLKVVESTNNTNKKATKNMSHSNIVVNPILNIFNGFSVFKRNNIFNNFFRITPIGSFNIFKSFQKTVRPVNNFLKPISNNFEITPQPIESSEEETVNNNPNYSNSGNKTTDGNSNI